MPLFGLGHSGVQVGEAVVTGVGRHRAVDVRTVDLALEVLLQAAGVGHGGFPTEHDTIATVHALRLVGRRSDGLVGNADLPLRPPHQLG